MAFKSVEINPFTLPAKVIALFNSKILLAKLMEIIVSLLDLSTIT
jgi:hypothetical protein